MYKVTAKNIYLPLLTFLLVISLGFVNKAEASSGTESTKTEEKVSYTTENPSPSEYGTLAEDYYHFSGGFENTLYTQSTVTVPENGSFWFWVDLYSINKSGFVDVIIQRQTLFGYTDVKTYTFNPNFDNPGGNNAFYYTHNLKAGEYRLKMTRSPSGNYTSVDGGMGGY